jgi:peptidoglycan/LPS O-acetylase OafA/YrhL
LLAVANLSPRRPMHHAKEPTDRLAPIDGLRGLAALLVIVGHHNMDPRWTLYWPVTFIQYTLSASLAVVLFFALSGFLLTYLAIREHDRTGSFSIRHFYVRRCFRILPLYCLALGVAVYAASPAGPFPVSADGFGWIVDNVWRFLTLTSNWSLALNLPADQSTPALAVLWTIAVEFQFYAVFPFAFVALTRCSTRQRIIVLAAIVLLAFGYRFIAYVHTTTAPPWLPQPLIYYASLSYADVFAFGAIAGWISAKGAAREIARSATAGPALLIMMVVAVFAWNRTLVDAWTLFYTIATALVGVTAACLLAWIAANGSKSIVRLLSSGPLVAVGMLSYGIYLWHPIGGSIYGALLTWQPSSMVGINIHAALSLALYIGFAVIIAAITYVTLERPAITFGRRLLRRQGPALVLQP